MSAAAAANVMLAMRVLACTSADYCKEFVDSGAEAMSLLSRVKCER